MEILIEQLHSDKDPGNVRERFNEIQKEVIIIFTSKEDVVKENSYSHGLANMALLDVSQNAALSNSVLMLKDTVSLIMIKKEDTFQFVQTRILQVLYSRGSIAFLLGRNRPKRLCRGP